MSAFCGSTASALVPDPPGRECFFLLGFEFQNEREEEGRVWLIHSEEE